MLTKLLIIFILIVCRIHVHAEDSNTTATFLAEKPDPNSNTYILNMKDPYVAKLKDINLENGEIKYKIFHKNAESEIVGFYAYENNIVKNLSNVDQNAIDSTVQSLIPQDAQFQEVQEITKDEDDLDLAQFLVSVFMLDADRINIDQTLLNNKITLQSPYKRAFNEDILDERSLLFYVKFFVKIDPWLLDLNSFIFFLFVPYVIIAFIIKKGINTIDKTDNDSVIERTLVAVVILYLFYFSTTSNQVSRTHYQSFFTEFIQQSLELSTNFTNTFSSSFLSYQARNSGKLDKQELTQIITDSSKNQAMLPYYTWWFNACKNAYETNIFTRKDEGFIFPKNLETNHLGSTWSERSTQKDTSVLLITSLEFCHNIEAKVKFLTKKQATNAKLITDYQESTSDKLNERQLVLLQQMQMQNVHDFGFISAPLIASNNMFSENLNMFQRTQKSRNEIETAITQNDKNAGLEKGVIADSIVADAIGILPYMLVPGADSIKKTVTDTLGAVSSKFEKLPFVGSFATAAKQAVGIGTTIFLLKYTILYLPIIALMLASFLVIVYYLISVIIYLNLSPFVAAWAFAKGQNDALKSFFIKGVILAIKPLVLVISIVISVIGLDLVKALNLLIIEKQFNNFFAITMTQNTLSTAYAFSDDGLLFIKGFIGIVISVVASIIVFYIVLNGSDVIARILGIDERTSSDTQNTIGNQVDQKTSRFSKM